MRTNAMNAADHIDICEACDLIRNMNVERNLNLSAMSTIAHTNLK